MHWILQNDIFSERGWTELVATLERFGLPHSVTAQSATVAVWQMG